jgi:hypothetical protein
MPRSSSDSTSTTRVVKNPVQGWTNRGMSDTLSSVTVKPKTSRIKTFAEDVKSGIKGASKSAGGGVGGAIASALQLPNIVGISAMGQQGYKKRKSNPSTPGGKKPLFRDSSMPLAPTQFNDM